MADRVAITVISSAIFLSAIVAPNVAAGAAPIALFRHCGARAVQHLEPSARNEGRNAPKRQLPCAPENAAEWNIRASDSAEFPLIDSQFVMAVTASALEACDR